MDKPIRGKVAQVINERAIALNVGTANGVAVGMYFEVMQPIDVRDPDTGEILGHIEDSKVKVKVYQVQQRLSLAHTPDDAKFLDNLGPFAKALLSSRTTGNISVERGNPVVQIME